ncbi:MAG: DUF427 domain-containing protein [Polyangiales bacterium]
MKVPGPDHPISIEPNGERVVVRFNGQTIADSKQALALRESRYPKVLYIPRQDVEMSLLGRTEHSTHCPYKGDAAYYSIQVGGREATNAVWTYESPFPAVAAIKDHVAFYTDRVDAIEELPSS